MSLSKGYIGCGVENNQVGVRGWEGPWGYPFHWLHVVFCGCWGACHLMCTMQLFGSMHAALLEYSLDTTSDKIEKCLLSGSAVQGRAGWGREGG